MPNWNYDFDVSLMNVEFDLISMLFFSKNCYSNKIKKYGGLYGRDNKDHALSGYERG